MTPFGSTVIALSAMMSSAAFAQEPQLKDLNVEQNSVAKAVSPRSNSLKVTIASDRPDPTYAAGEAVRLTLSSNEEAYVTILDVGPNGQVTQLFPNQFQPDNHVFADRPVEIGGGNVGARITVSPPFGAELIKVIASSKPMSVIADAELQPRGPFRSLNGGVPTLMRDLEVVANQPALNETKVSLSNFALYTVASRAPAPAASPTAALPVAAPQTASLISIPSQQPFPLLVAADKSAFKIGEKVTLAVTTLQTCNLTVLDVSTSGQVKTLFPNQTTPDKIIAAMQTVLVSGGPSTLALPVSGPVGTEQIVAICSTEAGPVVPSTDAGGDRSALARDLTVVANRPAGSTAMASITFVVQP